MHTVRFNRYINFVIISFTHVLNKCCGVKAIKSIDHKITSKIAI